MKIVEKTLTDDGVTIAFREEEAALLLAMLEEYFKENPREGTVRTILKPIMDVLPKTPVTFTKLQGGELQKMILEAHGDDDKHSLITQLTGTLNQCIKKWAPMEKLQ